jgi:hypothetical protein
LEPKEVSILVIKESTEIEDLKEIKVIILQD